MIKLNSNSYVPTTDKILDVDCDIKHLKNSYSALLQKAVQAPAHWQDTCTHNECSLHQLSPYIGKLKSSIAHELIVEYSKPNDLVVDPFAGSGTIPLEAALLSRRTFSSDISTYAKILCRAKLTPPSSLKKALRQVDKTLKLVKQEDEPDLRSVPRWVQIFFHPRTLKEVMKFASICRRFEDDFLMACLLGILHHQRPGFLSYPSSHLVPYLRCKKYPKSAYADLYAYRELAPRIIAKVERAYKRTTSLPVPKNHKFRQIKIQNISFPRDVDCLISSPPYMNTLDYERDNRLRLWFAGQKIRNKSDRATDKIHFWSAISNLSSKVEMNLKKGGHCILIVGERVTRSHITELSLLVCKSFSIFAPSLQLMRVIKDEIPDIRRSRRDCRGTKNEHILVFKRSK